MLKWAVNGPIRQTYLLTLENENLTINDKKVILTPTRNTKKLVKRPLKRKSSSTNDVYIKVTWHEKGDNRYTSTPLPQTQSQNEKEQQHSAKRQCYDVRQTEHLRSKFKKLSNTRAITSQMVKTPEKSESPLKQMPTSYASTLPPFEVEYSPSNNIISGSILALRGIGLRDNYFERPRYLNSNQIREHESKTELRNISGERHTTNTPDKIPDISQSTTLTSFINVKDSEESLSSSKMGDATLERVIDAILASTHKDRKLQKPMSPTYTPADDPASDLHELWDKRQKRSSRYSERYVNQSPSQNLKRCRQQNSRSYDSVQGNHSIILRRQRAIRRKRKISEITLNMRTTSAQGHSNNNQPINNQTIEENQKSKAELKKEFKENEKLIENINVHVINLDNIVHRISPDSGHNSVNEYDDEEKENIPPNEINDKITRTQCRSPLDITKRRLSFSIDTF